MKTHTPYIRPRIRVIQQVVADFYELPLELMRDPLRTRDVAEARMVAMALSRKLTRHSLQDIGASFDRDHGTVRHAVIAIDALLSTNARFVQEYARISQLVTDQLQAFTPQALALQVA